MQPLGREELFKGLSGGAFPFVMLIRGSPLTVVFHRGKLSFWGAVKHRRGVGNGMETSSQAPGCHGSGHSFGCTTFGDAGPLVEAGLRACCAVRSSAILRSRRRHFW